MMQNAKAPRSSNGPLGREDRAMSGMPLLAGRFRHEAMLKAAVHRDHAARRQKLLERLFTFAFNGLVYPQIWEDPVPDLEALALRPGSHVVTIASGGCNVLSYLTADPARITAVDLNHAHIALTDLKLAAARHLPGYEDFKRFFLHAKTTDNVELYDRLLAPRLGSATRAYWEASGLNGRRRISLFARDLYRHGLLGKFIGFGHVLARLYGVDLDGLMASRDLLAQKAYFEQHIAPIFDKRLVRWITDSPISLYGLGIPPAQYQALADGEPMADVLRERLGRLAAGFPLKDNYFAWQAFRRHYPDDPAADLPLYLQERHFEAMRERAGRVQLVRRSVTEVLDGQPAASVDGVVLLDAQDWMTAAQLDRLWEALTIACRPGARVVFRSAGRRSVLPGQVREPTLARWRYHQAMSGRMLAKDRSAIYGGFHLYQLEGRSR
jgi:S-adenosylmethionine-diacylglycerol 3-amino-3-carboxypropyl transferase